MTESKRNPNPFIRASMAAKEVREQKFNIDGVQDKVAQVGKAPKIMAISRAVKAMRNKLVVADNI
jgi:hypothetical protein